MNDQNNTNQKNPNQNQNINQGTQKPQKPGAEPVRAPQSGTPQQQGNNGDKGDLKRDGGFDKPQQNGDGTKKY